jgi:hypothetical protein
VIVPSSADNPFPDVYPMHAARLLERLEGYKVPVVAGATALGWTYDPDRKSSLTVRRGGKTETLTPFHSAVSVAGWPYRARPPRIVNRKGGATIQLGDTPFAEPLRDLVTQAHLLARRI